MSFKQLIIAVSIFCSFNLVTPFDKDNDDVKNDLELGSENGTVVVDSGINEHD